MCLVVDTSNMRSIYRALSQPAVHSSSEITQPNAPSPLEITFQIRQYKSSPCFPRMEQANMEFLTSPESAWKICLVLIAAAAVYSFLHRSPMNFLWKSISLRGRRDSTAITPPRSISPEKKNANSATSPLSYYHTLPPQRRESLLQLKGVTFRWREVDEAEVRQNALPMTADYTKSPGNLYTPTGFSVDQVKALGDFPDYATLSGIPLPESYPEHDIEKAQPRPYRPFRWAYHQTMCKCRL